MAINLKPLKLNSYLGVTTAYKWFRKNSYRTHVLLEAGLSGLDEKSKEANKFAAIFKDVKAPIGRPPKKLRLQPKLLEIENGKYSYELDIWTAKSFKDLADFNVSHIDSSRFHLYSILAVSIWGTFETYVVMVLEDIYRKRPELLKSGDQLTVSEVIENRDGLIPFLIERQLGVIGHWSLDAVLQYLDKRLNFKPLERTAKRLAEYYLIRNIFAHNSGVTRPPLNHKIPTSLTVNNGELRLTKKYVLNMLNDIHSLITILERHIQRKFYPGAGARTLNRLSSPSLHFLKEVKRHSKITSKQGSH